jgi:hypothetical protein
MSDVPVVPSPLYGLRTWTIVGESGSERLAGPQRGVSWPTGGEWLEAQCPRGHAPPARDCDCGVHGWHPRSRSARRVMGSRGRIAGVVEATGAIELYADGFRAERARPHALVLDAGRNPSVVRRLAAAYDVPLIEARRPGELLEWCRARGLGLDEPVVAGLLGEAAIEARRRAQRTRALRTVAALAVVAVLLAIGLLVTDFPGDRALSGRAGEVQQQR